MEVSLDPEELQRYARHLILPQLGLAGQLRLKQAKVLVVGAGGLGSPVLLYLAAAGIGTIGIVDFDRVEDSNLQRQVLFGVDDVGALKAEAARLRLQALNPHVNVQVHDCALRADNALAIIQQYDVVADGTDNFQTRYLVNDACILLGKVNVYASIFQFDGQVSVFNALLADGSRGPNYRDIFPNPPAPGTVPNCAEGGVLGVLPGIIGSLQANEVIKVCAGIGEPLIGRLLILDALRMEFRTLKFKKDPSNPLTGAEPSIFELIDYDAFCGITGQLRSITVQELKAWQEAGRSFQLIDVRTQEEYAQQHLGGQLMPLASIVAHVDAICLDRPVVIHCKSGKRSEAAIKALQELYPDWQHLHNLDGGLLAWEAAFGPIVAE